VQRLGYSTIKTNLWTVAPNAVGFVVLLLVCYSSDYFRERTFHIVFALTLSLVGMIILASIDVLHHTGVAYFACFLLAAGAYVPSSLVQSWHNNNNLNENSRAATTGLFVGLGNLAGIISAATFRTEYTPKYVHVAYSFFVPLQSEPLWLTLNRYIPTLIATCCCNVVCIFFTLGLGIWMKRDNARRDREQGVKLDASKIDTSTLTAGTDSPNWRHFS
jgi:hypothetical protein